MYLQNDNYHIKSVMIQNMPQQVKSLVIQNIFESSNQ